MLLEEVIVIPEAYYEPRGDADEEGRQRERASRSNELTTLDRCRPDEEPRRTAGRRPQTTEEMPRKKLRGGLRPLSRQDKLIDRCPDAEPRTRDGSQQILTSPAEKMLRKEVRSRHRRLTKHRNAGPRGRSQRHDDDSGTRRMPTEMMPNEQPRNSATRSQQRMPTTTEKMRRRRPVRR